MPGLMEELEVRSDEVQEILGEVPHWIIRWGITSIFMVLVFILIGAWFIEYPDTVSAEVTLTTEDPPVKIISRSSGTLQLFVEDRETVLRGQPLGVIDNTASLSDALVLIDAIDTIHDGLPDSPKSSDLSAFFPDSLQLGNLQRAYQDFLMSIGKKENFIAINKYEQEVNALSSQIKKYIILGDQLEKQTQLQREQVNLAYKDLKRDSILLTVNSESLATFEATKSDYYRSLNSLEQSISAVTRNEIQLDDLKTQLTNAKTNQRQSIFELDSDIDNNYQRLKSSVEEWRQEYLLTSPIDGIVTFTEFWQDGQFANTGEEVMTIVPRSEAYYVRAELPLVGSGKVKQGDQVIIRFNNYPEEEYGTIRALVERISLVPREKKYVVKVSLLDGLKTSYDQELEFRQEMEGIADIITEDLRLLDRIFNNLRKLLSN